MRTCVLILSAHVCCLTFDLAKTGPSGGCNGCSRIPVKCRDRFEPACREIWTLSLEKKNKSSLFRKFLRKGDRSKAVRP